MAGGDGRIAGRGDDGGLEFGTGQAKPAGFPRAARKGASRRVAAHPGAGRDQARDDLARLRARAPRQEPGRRVRERRRPRHAGGDERRRKPQGARVRAGCRRRPSCRPRSASAAPATFPSSRSIAPRGTTSPSRATTSISRSSRSRSISRSMPRPTSPPGRSPRAIRKPASIPRAFIASCSRTRTGSASRCIRAGACGSFIAAPPPRGRTCRPPSRSASIRCTTWDRWSTPIRSTCGNSRSSAACSASPIASPAAAPPTSRSRPAPRS